jgi:hypothetical protein
MGRSVRLQVLAHPSDQSRRALNGPNPTHTTVVEPDILPFDPPEIRQRLSEGRHTCASVRLVLRPCVQHAVEENLASVAEERLDQMLGQEGRETAEAYPAKALGLSVPPSVLAGADEVIE